MRRKTLDTLLSATGLLLALVLLVAGGLLTWASTFAQGQVHDQLAAQKITMPSGKALEDPQIKPYLEKYAGQEMTTGDQAKAFADHYILVHMNEASGGKTYAELDREDPVRDVVMNGSFLRASLFTSVVSFGIAAMAMGLGIVFVLVGAALRVVGRPQTA